MNKGIDLRQALDEWPYDPDNHIRRVRCADGREVLQVRLSLGLEQYELTGRPDGLRPNGCESLLDYHLERLTGLGGEFSLNPEECAELFSEAMQYYYRYLNLFQIRDWVGTLRDTTRNLQLFDFVHQYAVREEDQNYLEQWRPYILRLHATAAAMIQVEGGTHAVAVEVLQKAIQQIESLEDREDQTFQFERKRSLLTLRELVRQIEKSRPVPPLERLERELRNAIELQNFEQAAQLRDQIKALKNNPSSPRDPGS